MRTMIAHARSARPAECCGVLVGSAGRVVDAVAVRNRATAVNRYELDPREHIAARRDARARGLDVVGFYHSHPEAPARPSAVDIAEATYRDLIHVIVGRVEVGHVSGDASAAPDDDALEIRAFQYSGSGYVEVPIRIENSADTAGSRT
jgi:proteasome lid subunit RPN8/RPN11